MTTPMLRENGGWMASALATFAELKVLKNIYVRAIPLRS